MTYTYRYYWRFLLLQFLIFTGTAVFLRFIFNSDIGVPSACINFEDDFNNTCAKSEKSIRDEELVNNNIKYNFFLVVVILFFKLVLTTLTFSADLKTFLNEQRNVWYSTGVYYWSKAIVELIPTVIILVCFSYIGDIYD
ncbi:unnamed protein product, partial [Oppiella nova]